MSIEAVSFGTASICKSKRLGASFTLDLGVDACVELTKGGRIFYSGDEHLKNLVRNAVKKTLEYSDVKSGVRIKVENSITSGVGLGEVEAAVAASSAAVAGALAKREGSLIELRVDKFLSEQVLVVGDRIVDKNVLVDLCKQVKGVRFDRLAASIYGGFTVCDNLEKKVLRRGEMEEMTAILIVGDGSDETAYDSLVDSELEVVCNEALRGNLYSAMNLNSLACGDRNLSARLLENGALAISTSGKTSVGLVRNEKRIDDVVNSINAGVLVKKLVNEGVRVLGKPKKIMKVNEFLKLKERILS